MSTQVAGENPPAPGSGPSSPSSVEPGASVSGVCAGSTALCATLTAAPEDSAQSAASPSVPSVAGTNTTAGSGAGSGRQQPAAGPERTPNAGLIRVYEQYGRRALRSHNRIFNGPDTPRARRIRGNIAFNLAAAGRVWELANQ